MCRGLDLCNGPCTYNRTTAPWPCSGIGGQRFNAVLYKRSLVQGLIHYGPWSLNLFKLSPQIGYMAQYSSLRIRTKLTTHKFMTPILKALGPRRRCRYLRSPVATLRPLCLGFCQLPSPATINISSIRLPQTRAVQIR